MVTRRPPKPHSRASRVDAIDQLHRLSAVYTTPEVVETILDAVGWRSDQDLSSFRLLEPAAGNGEFVLRAARRLVSSYRRYGVTLSAQSLSDRITAFEFQHQAVSEARARVVATLRTIGLHHNTARACSIAWIRHEDFLLTDLHSCRFTHVVGNPPYTRWSKIPAILRDIYDDRLPEEITKGDLFIPFLHRAFEHVTANGMCGLVCSDRWKYMAFAESFRRKWLPLLDVISDDPVDAGVAFSRHVDAYPTILIARKRTTKKPASHFMDARQGSTLEQLGCTIRVGPALGHTPAFVLEVGDDEDVEPQLLHAWVDGSEISDGVVNWRGRRVIEMFDDDGRLIDLQEYPRLATRLCRFSSALRSRSIVRNGAPWYRTIERVRATDWCQPKLLVPELAKIPRVALDRAGLIPSHGVYAIFPPSGDDIDDLYTRLSNGRLAEALHGIAPRIKAGYVRCYRRFLLKIRL